MGYDGGPGEARRPQWTNNLLLPLAVVVVGALVLAVVTPIGAAARELFFPTKAAVSGTVELAGAPAARAAVRLEAASGTTDHTGHFLLSSAGAGRHRLHVETPGARPLDYPFTVTAGADDVDLGVIKVDPLVLLGYYAAVQPPGSAGQTKVKYDLTLWLAGADDALGQVREVVYALPAPLSSDRVSVADLAGAFCYRVRGTVKFEQLMVLGGAFSTASATVRLSDGEDFALSAQPGAQQPPGCAAHKGTTSDSGSDSSSGSTTAGGSGSSTGNPGGTVQQTTRVPPVDGLPEDGAVTLLAAAGFRITTEHRPDENVPEGSVASTRPAGGAQAKKGSTVTVLVSTGNGEKPVPDVTRHPLDEATAILDGDGFRVEVIKISGTAEPVDQVLKQDPEAGKLRPPKSTVTLTVRASTGS